MKRIDKPNKLTNWNGDLRNRLFNHKTYFCRYCVNKDDISSHLSNLKIFEDLTERRNCMIISQNFIETTLDYITDISTSTDVMIDRLFHYLTTDDTLISDITSNIFKHDAYIRLLKSSEALANICTSESWLHYAHVRTTRYIRTNILAMRLILVLNLIKEYAEKVIPDEIRNTEDGEILFNIDLRDIMDITPWYDVL